MLAQYLVEYCEVSQPCRVAYTHGDSRQPMNKMRAPWEGESGGGLGDYDLTAGMVF